jgi:NADH-quinone oxidoreductase subunit N
MTVTELMTDLRTALPLAVLVGWACLLLIIDLFVSARRKGITALLAAVGLFLVAVITLLQAAQLNGASQLAFGGMLVVDGYASFLMLLFLGSGLAGIALSYDYLKQKGIERGEYYSLLLFSIAGMLLMAQAADLIVVFLALELLSIPLYILAGFARSQAASEEAALKYFLLGAFSGGFVVYGVALVFGATGSTALAQVVAAVAGGTANLGLLAAGAGLILIGLGFKVAAVPFHMWTQTFTRARRRR